MAGWEGYTLTLGNCTSVIRFNAWMLLTGNVKDSE